ncbi:MAG TPA: YcnI family protein [Symbiobacteriaceae bacterium]|jgi:uncharacterized protein YcnI
MLRKTALAMLMTLMMLVAVSGIASAHAVVYPKTAVSNSYQAFALRVPTEKEVPTIQLRVEMPADFAVSRVRPLPGWTYAVEKTADGKAIKAITWTGGKILPGEYQDFEFQGKTAANPGKYAFRAFQTYADGETVEWTGPADAKTPASIVEVVAGVTTTDAHGQEQAIDHKPTGAPATPPGAPATAPTSAPAGSNPWTAAAAYGGFVLAVAALLVAFWRR